jgi:hypothetical protein
MKTKGRLLEISRHNDKYVLYLQIDTQINRFEASLELFDGKPTFSALEFSYELQSYLEWNESHRKQEVMKKPINKLVITEYTPLSINYDTKPFINNGR